jgi:hypothetical protein
MLWPLYDMKDNDDDNVRELNLPDIEQYLDIHKKQIIDSIMDRMFKGIPNTTKNKGSVYPGS